MMCVDCLDFYHHKFSSPELLETISRPPWDKMSDTEILAKLPLIADTATQVNGFLGQWVQMARERNLSLGRDRPGPRGVATGGLGALRRQQGPQGQQHRLSHLVRALPAETVEGRAHPREARPSTASSLP